jgi:hypothetical protein
VNESSKAWLHHLPKISGLGFQIMLEMPVLRSARCRDIGGLRANVSARIPNEKGVAFGEDGNALLLVNLALLTGDKVSNSMRSPRSIKFRELNPLVS